MSKQSWHGPDSQKYIRASYQLLRVFRNGFHFYIICGSNLYRQGHFGYQDKRIKIICSSLSSTSELDPPRASRFGFICHISANLK